MLHACLSLQDPGAQDKKNRELQRLQFLSPGPKLLDNGGDGSSTSAAEKSKCKLCACAVAVLYSGLVQMYHVTKPADNAGSSWLHLSVWSIFEELHGKTIFIHF